MIVVSDSSPLIVLINIGRVDLLPALYGRVVIPPDVKDELSSPKRTTVVQAFASAIPTWLEVKSPLQVEPIPLLQLGEAAAISLARECQADLLLIDEKIGRKAATDRGLSVVGTVGVLERAAEKKLVDLGQAFEDVKKTDFWISPKLLDKRLALFLERERSAATGSDETSSS